jgi:uncharacterized protein (DUF58 family)
MTLPAPKAEAAREAERLGRLVAEARRAAMTLSPGGHGLRRPGPGETFWQHREHRAEEGPRAIDWRRSARSDRLYARDRERETPATLLFWADARPGMVWRSAQSLPTKAERAQAGALALGFAFLNGGERVQALGAPPTSSPERFAAALARGPQTPDRDALAVTQRHGVLWASDGLEPLEVWARRMASLRRAGAAALLLVADPAEEDFPYEGRTLFEDPAGREAPELLGRAERSRERYRALYRSHRAGLTGLAEEAGVRVVAHRTDAPLAPALLALACALGARRQG